MSVNKNDNYTTTPKSSSCETTEDTWVTPKLERLPISATKIGSVSTSFEGGMTNGGQVYSDSSPS